MPRNNLILAAYQEQFQYAACITREHGSRDMAQPARFHCGAEERYLRYNLRSFYLEFMERTKYKTILGRVHANGIAATVDTGQQWRYNSGPNSVYEKQLFIQPSMDCSRTVYGYVGSLIHLIIVNVNK
jgi:hypothetical protein